MKRSTGFCLLKSLTLVCCLTSILAAQGVTITPNSATSTNLYVKFNDVDPERIDEIKWNPQGLSGSELNLTNSGTTGSPPCFNGDVEYFGNSWAPPDLPTGKVFVGSGTEGVRVKGPDSKVVINSISNNCAPNSANVAVNTIYKFWRGGEAINKMRVTRSFTFETPFEASFRPFIPRLYPISSFSQVLFPDALGTTLITRNISGFGGGACPFGCTVTDWDGNSESGAWFAIHDPVSGKGVVIKRAPTANNVALWLDWDGASETNSSSVILLPPAAGFTGEVSEMQTLCFYDSTTWIPSLETPRGC